MFSKALQSIHQVQQVKYRKDKRGTEKKKTFLCISKIHNMDHDEVENELESVNYEDSADFEIKFVGKFLWHSNFICLIKSDTTGNATGRIWGI